MRMLLATALIVAGCGGGGSPPGTRTPTGVPGSGTTMVHDGGVAVDAAIASRDLAVARLADLSPAPITDLAKALPPSDLSTVLPPDLGETPDLAKSVGPPGGSPCTTACDCPGDAVCYGGRCVTSSWANQGHPVILFFSCCDWYRANGTCTASVGCQRADGQVVNCAGAACNTIACNTQSECADVGCRTVCNSMTHTCQ